MNADNPSDARAMLDLIDDQRRRVDRDDMLPTVWLYGIWAAAWFLGYLGLFLAWIGVLAAPVAGIAFAVLILGSIVASAVIGSRIGRGVKGASQFSGIVYGVSWSLCSIAFALLGWALVLHGLSGDLASLYYPSAFAIMCGSLYLGGAAIWGDRLQLVLGAALLLVGGVAPFAGLGANLLIMSLAGLLLFGAGAVVSARRLAR